MGPNRSDKMSDHIGDGGQLGGAGGRKLNMEFMTLPPDHLIPSLACPEVN